MLKTIHKFAIVICLMFLCISIGNTQVSSEKRDFEYGKKLFSEDLFELSVIQFSNFIDNYPNSPLAPEAQFRAGESALALGRFEQARNSFLKVLVQYPASSFVEASEFQIAVTFEKEGKLSEAVQSYARIFQFHPEGAFAMEGVLRSGNLLQKLENFTEAEQAYKRILEWNSPDEFRAKAVLQLARLYEKTGDYERAVQTLKPIAERGDQSENHAEALFLLGEIVGMKGYWEESAKYYQSCVKMTRDANLIQRSVYQLGMLFQLLGDDTQAVEYYRKATEGNDQALKSKAWNSLGKVQVQLQQFEQAVQSFLSAEEASPDQTEKLICRLNRAETNIKMEARESAKALLKSILSESEKSESEHKRGLLLLAKLYKKEDNPVQALSLYDTYIRNYPGDQLVPYVLLEKGRISIQSLSLWDEGFYALRQIWEVYPGSTLIPEVRWIYGRGLESVQRVTEALQIYHSILRQYPGSIWSEQARREIERLEMSQGVDYEKGMVKLSDLLQIVLTQEKMNDIYWELGQIAFNDLKHYRKAIHYFLKYLTLEEESAQKDEILFRIGESYSILFNLEKNETCLDSAEIYYQQILAGYPDSPFADDAGFKMAEINLRQSAEKGIVNLKDLIFRYPDSPLRAGMVYRLGKGYKTMDSLETAMPFFKNILEMYDQAEIYPYAVFELADLNFRTGNRITADSLFNQYDETYKRTDLYPQVLYKRALIARKKPDEQSAIRFFEELMQSYPYSPWADSAVVPLGNAYLSTNVFSQAEKFYKESLARDSLLNMACKSGLIPSYESRAKELLPGYAKSLEGLNQYAKAKLIYLNLGKSYHDKRVNRSVFTALAKIAESEGRFDRAAGYLERLLDLYPSDTTAQSIGDLWFRLEDYGKAGTAYENALQLSGDQNRKAVLSRRIIVAQLRQDKIPQADVRINIFQQSYKKMDFFEDSMAEFAYEKGVSFIRRKDFDLALASLDEALQKYKRSPLVPDMKLEMGRIYLITNKVDQALDLLTRMTNDYPDHPVLAKVFLNLGDHYFRSQQFENAISAFQKAIDQNEPEVTQSALRYLIRVYDALRLWDTALRYTRTYIEQFPRAQDILQKRVQIGIYLINLNEYQRAISCLQEIKKSADFETEAEIQYWIGKSYYHMGQFEQAIFEFLKVEYLCKPTKLPWNTTALYEAGLAYLKLEKPRQAKTMFEKIIKKEGAASDMGRIARQRIEEIDS